MPLRDHAVDEPHAYRFHPVARALVTHRAAQFVGLAAGEAGRFDRHAHPLLLKERHAERSFQHRLEFGVRIGDWFEARAPAQERMDHLPLNRPGTNDRDLHDDVVEADRLHSRQHRLLGARLDLKDADRIGALHHLVGRLVVDGDRVQREIERHAGRQARIAARETTSVERERLAQQREHSQAEQIDLDQPQLLEVVFVPLHDGAIAHRRPFDRRDAHQRIARDQHAAGMDPQVARKVGDAAADGEEQIRPRLFGQLLARVVLACATRSTCSSDNPSALPTSRIAERVR